MKVKTHIFHLGTTTAEVMTRIFPAQIRDNLYRNAVALSIGAAVVIGPLGFIEIDTPKYYVMSETKSHAAAATQIIKYELENSPPIVAQKFASPDRKARDLGWQGGITNALSSFAYFQALRVDDELNLNNDLMAASRLLTKIDSSDATARIYAARNALDRVAGRSDFAINDDSGLHTLRDEVQFLLGWSERQNSVLANAIHTEQTAMTTQGKLDRIQTFYQASAQAFVASQLLGVSLSRDAADLRKKGLYEQAMALQAHWLAAAESHQETSIHLATDPAHGADRLAEMALHYRQIIETSNNLLEQIEKAITIEPQQDLWAQIENGASGAFSESAP